MTAELFNENGEAVEAFTPEEVEAKVAEQVALAIEDIHAKSADEQKTQEDAMAKLESDKAELAEKLKVAEEKGGNFKAIRDKADAKDKQIADLEKKMADTEAKVNSRIEEITNANKKAALDGQFLAQAGGDAELAEKIKIAYGKFAGVATTEEEVQQRMQDAMSLATGRPAKILGSNVISASGGSKVTLREGKVDPEVAEMAKRAFGITDKDLKKHKLI